MIGLLPFFLRLMTSYGLTAYLPVAGGPPARSRLGVRFGYIHIAVKNLIPCKAYAVFSKPKLPEPVPCNVPGNNVPLNTLALFMAFKDVIYK